MPADRQSGSAVAGSHPSEAPSVAGNSSASRFWCPERGPGLIPPESIGEAHPAQTVGRRDPAAVCLHPTPAPCCGWRLRVAGCFLLPGWVGGGGPREPPRCSEVGPGFLGKVIPAREFPPLLESWTSPITKGTLCLRCGQRQRAERGPSRAIPGDCLVLPLCLPCPPGAPTSRGSYARSLTFGQRKGLGSRGLLR